MTANGLDGTLHWQIACNWEQHNCLIGVVTSKSISKTNHEWIITLRPLHI